jgi:asparagine N-glycosylation enzyme membrane subunit Stt3
MQFPLYQRKILIGALLFCLLIITFCIRIQGTGHLSNLQFTGNDAYLYHWQAGIISEHGRLPARDMHRWLPLGRDNGQLLSLYAYAIQGYLVLRILIL